MKEPYMEKCKILDDIVMIIDNHTQKHDSEYYMLEFSINWIIIINSGINFLNHIKDEFLKLSIESGYSENSFYKKICEFLESIKNVPLIKNENLKSHDPT